jgi:hypothetical protein
MYAAPNNMSFHIKTKNIKSMPGQIIAQQGWWFELLALTNRLHFEA